MRSRTRVVAVGVIALVAGVSAGLARRVAEPAERDGSANQVAEIARRRDEIERLKGMVPDQSHGMKIMLDTAFIF